MGAQGAPRGTRTTRATRWLLTLVLVGLLAACSTITPTATPTPDPSPSLLGVVENAAVGVPLAARVLTHCGLARVLVNGEAFVFDAERTANAPPGFDNPWDVGTLVLTSETTATYTSSHGVEVTLHRVRPIPSIMPCA